MLGDGRTLNTELDHLVACIIEMRKKQQEPKGMVKSHYFEEDMKNYFRLPDEMCTAFIYDVLVRLSGLPAGSSQLRNPEMLQRVHDMHSGSYFRLDTRLCVFENHKRFQGQPTEGFMLYHYATEDWTSRELSYNDAWSMVEEGRLTFGH